MPPIPVATALVSQNQPVHGRFEADHVHFHMSDLQTVVESCFSWQDFRDALRTLDEKRKGVQGHAGQAPPRSAPWHDGRSADMAARHGVPRPRSFSDPRRGRRLRRQVVALSEEQGLPPAREAAEDPPTAGSDLQVATATARCQTPKAAQVLPVRRAAPESKPYSFAFSSIDLMMVSTSPRNASKSISCITLTSI